ncbi:hypothetical protein [Lysinibacillus parviboronicapiens]|uniref:hypothetical protein n=1 Tax=Lysinibacillus parviboronicapiens TaxID=436516 RepID=UPI000D3D5FF2|nr:hypothetical protein [Lysinibacillus parviboronicapiens]
MRKNRTKEELEKLIESVRGDFKKHHRKVEEITINTVLMPNEVIEIAKKYHQELELDGTVNEQIESLFFDEAYDDMESAWRVKVDLSPNPFLFEDYTIIVSDRDKEVMGMLDVNGQPVTEGNEFTDEEIAYIMSEEDPKGYND